MNNSRLKWLPALLATTLLGCGGGGGGARPPSAPANPPPPTTFTIGGTVAGLTGTVVLQNNAADDLTVTANGAFTFATPLATNTPYAVSVLTQPVAQSCTVANASSTIGQSNITDVAVTCVTNPPGTHTLGGHVDGLNGNSVVLQNNGGTEVTVSSTNPAFTFGSFAIGSQYAITVKAPPSFPAAKCFVNDAAGTIADHDVSVSVHCTAFPVPRLIADIDVSLAHKVKLAWFDFGSAVRTFNLYVSTRRDCDFRGNFTACPGEKLTGVVSGMVLTSFNGQPLRNGQAYFFQLESVYDNDAVGLSNRDGARPNEVAFDKEVKTMTVAPNGTVYLGGSFNSVGVTTGSAVPLDPGSGRFTAADYPIVDGTVAALAPDGAGGWFIGGTFTRVGSVPRRNLAHVGADGSVDPDFARWFPNGSVRALKRVGSTVFVGGTFDGICLPDESFCANRRNAAVIATNGGLSDWAPQPNDTVLAFEAMGNSLFMGGRFTGGSGRPGFLAKFDLAPDGSGTPLSSDPAQFDMDFNDTVQSLAAHGDALYVGGRFTSGNGAHCCVARIDFGNGPPSRSTTFNPDPFDHAQPATVTGLAVSNDGGVLYVGGFFNNILGPGGQLHGNLAAFSTADGVAIPWFPDPDGTVDSLAVAADGTVYASGAFGTIGSAPARFIRFNMAAVDPVTAETVVPFHPDPMARTNVLAIADGMLYAGGDFNHLHGAGRGRLAALAADGSLLPWNPGTNGHVDALLYHDNQFRGPVVYVGGLFSAIGSQQKANLAAVNAISGAVLPPDEFMGTTDGLVSALAINDAAGALYVGGAFTQIAGEPAKNLANLFFFNGTINLLFGFKPDPDGHVAALLATHDVDLALDVVYLAGAFNDVNGPGTHAHLAKLNADSGAPLTWTQHPNDFAESLALSSDGRVVYAGGLFTNVNGTATPGGLAAFDADGTLLLTGCPNCFNPAPAGGIPLALATNGDTVFAGGNFSAIGVGPMDNFAALTGFQFGTLTGFSSDAFVFPNGRVSGLAVSGNKIYVGGVFSGFFDSVNGAQAGAARGNFAVVDAVSGSLVQ